MHLLYIYDKNRNVNLLLTCKCKGDILYEFVHIYECIFITSSLVHPKFASIYYCLPWKEERLLVK